MTNDDSKHKVDLHSLIRITSKTAAAGRRIASPRHWINQIDVSRVPRRDRRPERRVRRRPTTDRRRHDSLRTFFRLETNYTTKELFRDTSSRPGSLVYDPRSSKRIQQSKIRC
ncbi:hypothetical protein EVAR_75096_1 [Eumeta japonica]|uniref:Uncharacterized protein n=1 Tax=Eumeta variegata TaxID=151549 RepID=A0A4C1U170_EUMVA|nr:hypothetical protein EVAR_75096_1 [Eumeta japonica]